MARPAVGICAAVEQARFGPWDELASLVPHSYPVAVQRSGGLALMLPPDPVAQESPAELLDRLDALVVAGGSDVDSDSYGGGRHAETKNTNPDRDRFEIALTKEALKRDMPVLGICRGMQIMNVAAGGTLEQHLPERTGTDLHRPPDPGNWAEHEIRLEPDSLVARAAGVNRFPGKSHHHQGVDELGSGFEITGWAVDDDTVEAIELPDRTFALGVLWHPEEDSTDRIIPALIKRAVERSGGG
jgi:putative glutamine amidotransferase